VELQQFEVCLSAGQVGEIRETTRDEKPLDEWGCTDCVDGWCGWIVWMDGVDQIAKILSFLNP
jgi:hypothetical protein